jgi:hypothetical protein
MSQKPLVIRSESETVGLTKTMTATLFESGEIRSGERVHGCRRQSLFIL